jgi:cellulose synthase/poly-beta-1,6-N-acetylglucosamine synthase-like glycosyltransferase
MSEFVVVLAVIVGLPGAGAALHLGLLAVASMFYRPAHPPAFVPHVRFVVLVPAHNEEKVLGATLAALFADRRPDDQVLVVADRCSDATAEIARRAGALVLQRQPWEEAGRAAARQDGVRYALEFPWDAMVMIDADSIIEPGFFAACERALASGAEALQARSEAARGQRLLDQAAIAAFAIQGVLMPRGRDRLGLLVRLRGTGMVLTRRIVSQARFRAPASEDLWYSLDLCLQGVTIRHVEDARLRSLNAGSWQSAGTQRVRYEAGRMSAAREFVGPLLRRHSWASLEAAWFLLTPPFAVAALSLGIAVGLAALGGSVAVVGVGLGLLAVLVGALLIALAEARAGRRTWLALAIAPWYIPWKAIVQVRALLSLRRGVRTYGATPR